MSSIIKIRCVVFGCDRWAATHRGLCRAHYESARREGVLGLYPVQRRLPGHRVIEDGYARLWYPHHPLAGKTGYVQEHRFVAWEVFGPFDVSHHVHHKDENTLNNDPSNLEVLPPREHYKRHRVRTRRVEPTEERRHRDAEIVRLSKTGMTGREVAEQVGCSDSTVSKVLTRHGIAPSAFKRLG